jgi:Xaa-Pro aminopeptidase
MKSLPEINMTTRRRFLQSSALAASAALAPVELTARAKEPAHSENHLSLPPTIAQLKSMQAQAEPITKLERQQRIEKAQRLMAENHLDAILMSGGKSLVYFSNIKWWLSERFFGMVLPAKGRPFYVCPAFEHGRALEQILQGPLDHDPDIRTWQEDENPYALTVQGLKDRGITSGRVGVEETTYFVYSNGVAQHAPALEMVSATPVTAGCRMIKSAAELRLMQLANNVTLKAFEAVYRSTKPGMTDKDIGTLISSAHSELGFQGDALVLVDDASALPHGSIQPHVIHEGSLVLIDGGCSVEGYQSDISRSFAVGKPSDKMKKNFEIVHRAQSAALAAARPGVEAQSVDAAARQVITDAGYGPDYKFFTHRVGHGIGMDGHEWTYLVRGNKTALRPRMCFSDEPGIYIRGEFGIRLEDDMHITDDGAKLFTPQSPSLEEPFGNA